MEAFLKITVLIIHLIILILLHLTVFSVLYLTATSLVSTASVMLSVLVLNIHHRDAEMPVPNWLRVLCFKYMTRVLCISARKPKTFANLEKTMDFENRLQSKKGATRKLAEFTPMIASVIVPNGKVMTESVGDQNDGDRDNAKTRMYQRNGDARRVSSGWRSSSSYDNTGHSHSCNGRKSSATSRSHLYSKYNGKSNSYQHHASERHMAESWSSLVNKSDRRRLWSYSYEWREIAHVLDRFFFVVVFIFSIITVIMFLLTPYYKQPYTYNFQ